MAIQYLSGREALLRFPQGEVVFCGLREPVEELEPRPIAGFFRGGPYEDPLEKPRIYLTDSKSQIRSALRLRRRQTDLASRKHLTSAQAAELETLTRLKLEPHPLVHTSSARMYATAYGIFNRPELRMTWNAGGRYLRKSQEACMTFALSRKARNYLNQESAAVQTWRSWVHVLPMENFQASIVAGEYISDRSQRPIAIVQLRPEDLGRHWSELPLPRRLGHGPSEQSQKHKNCWHVPQAEEEFVNAMANWPSFGVVAPRRPVVKRRDQIRTARRD